MIAQSELLTVAGLDGALVSATDAARARRDELLAIARRGLVITSQESARRAAALLTDLTAFAREIENAREEVKSPVLDLGRKIDLLAKELASAVRIEAQRIGGLLGTWQAEQNRLAEEQRRKAEDEARRIRDEAARREREAEEKVRREQEERDAAARKEQQELAAKAARARSEAGRAKAEQEAKAAAERAETSRIEAEQRAAIEQQRRIDDEATKLVASQQAIVTATPKPEGVSTRREVKYEVTDIVALYEAAPFLVKMEANHSALVSALKALQPGRNLPGVRHWTEAKSIVR